MGNDVHKYSYVTIVADNISNEFYRSDGVRAMCSAFTNLKNIDSNVARLSEINVF